MVGACGGDVLGVGRPGSWSQRLFVDVVCESVEGVDIVDGVIWLGLGKQDGCPNCPFRGARVSLVKY